MQGSSNEEEAHKHGAEAGGGEEIEVDEEAGGGAKVEMVVVVEAVRDQGGLDMGLQGRKGGYERGRLSRHRRRLPLKGLCRGPRHGPRHGLRRGPRRGLRLQGWGALRPNGWTGSIG